MTISTLSSLKYRALFLLLPIFYILFSVRLIHTGGGFYMTGNDPVYPYLMNALNLAGGHMEVGIIEHPGTPLEYLGAIIIRVKHFFCTSTISVTEDVLMHPESYLYTCAYTLASLLALVCFLTAHFVYRKTGNVFIALFLQLPPIVAPDLLQHATLLKPEAFIIIIVTFLSAYLYVKVFGKSEDNEWDTQSIILCGVLMGVLIASKIICAPFVLILYLLLKGVKKKIIFSAVLGITFLVSIIPILPKYRLMFHWLTDLWKHDGHYGHGTERVLDPSQFFSHLIKIATANFAFTIVYLALTLALGLIVWRIIRKKQSYDSTARLISGLWLSFVILTFFVAKHFSFHYMICAEAFAPAALLSSVSIISLSLPWTIRTKGVLGYITGIGFVLFLCTRLWIGFGWFKDSYGSMDKTKEFISTQGSIPAITIAEDHSSFLEPSIWFGIVYTGNMRGEYFSLAKQKYPNWYYYLPQTNGLFHWDEEVFILDLLRKNSKILVYFIDRSPDQEKEALDKLCTSDSNSQLATYHKVYTNDVMTEDVYIIDVDPSKLPKEETPRIRIASNLETLGTAPESFLSSDGTYHFLKGELVNHQEYHSGNSSILLDAHHPYGLDLKFDVVPGDYVEVSIWRKATDQIGAIVLAAKDASRFYSASNAITKSDSNGWQQIKCRVRIPDDYPEKLLNFYLYYEGKQAAYFDDVLITVTPGK